MIRRPTNEEDASAVALHALAVTLGDSGRASRLLDVTGLDPSDLRARAGEPELLAAVLRFLEAHEPDLLAVAKEMQVRPEELVSARIALEA